MSLDRRRLVALVLGLPIAAGAALASCDSESGASCPSEVALGEGELVLEYWGNTDGELARIDLGMDASGCAVEVEGAPITASFEGTQLVLVADASGASSGLSEGALRLVDGSGSTVGERSLRWRALLPGDGDQRRVLVIGIDGLRPDALQAAATPNLDAIRDHAVWTDAGSTQIEADTKSGPGWASILTGVEATKHLVVSNDTLDQIDHTYATVPQRVEDAGLSARVLASWNGVGDMLEEAQLDGYETGFDLTIADLAEASLATEDHDLLFLHFDEVDSAGHAWGFSVDSEDYLWRIEQTDEYVGRLLDTIVARSSIADETWMIAVVTDHGGEGTDHGARNAACRTIPQGFASPAIPAGALTDASHLDLLPTTLAFLGVEPQAGWELDGKVAVRAE